MLTHIFALLFQVIAVDVDVYDRDRVHGGNQALMGNKSKIGLAGRLASRVPRFATIELRDTYKVPKRKSQDESTNNIAKKTDDDEEMRDAENANCRCTSTNTWRRESQTQCFLERSSAMQPNTGPDPFSTETQTQDIDHMTSLGGLGGPEIERKGEPLKISATLMHLP